MSSISGPSHVHSKALFASISFIPKISLENEMVLKSWLLWVVEGLGSGM